MMTPALGPLLRRPGALEEHAQHVHDVRRRDRGRDRHLGGGRLLARLRRRATASSAASTTPSSTTSPSSRATGRRSRTCSSSPSRRPSASSPRRWSPARWSSGCASARSWSSRRCGRCSSTPCSPTGRSAAAGCRRAARSTSPAASRSRWAPGFSALAAALVVGARKDYGRQALLPHNAVYVLLGAGLLWFGWFGFNGGSGFSTGNPSVLAFTNTLLTPGLHARRWFVLDLDPRPEGDRDRRRDGDHRRLRAITPAGGFISPGLGDGARRARRAAELRGDRLAAADAGRRDARRARRARHRRLHRDPLHRLLRPGWPGTGSPTASFYGNADQLGDQALAALAAPVYAFGVTFVLLQADRRGHAAARERARGGAGHGRRPARRGGLRQPARARSSIMPDGEGAEPHFVAEAAPA